MNLQTPVFLRSIMQAGLILALALLSPAVWANAATAQVRILPANGVATDAITLGQPITIEARLPSGSGGNQIQVQLSDWGGGSETVTLNRVDNRNGVSTYAAQTSIGGRRGGLARDGQLTGLTGLANGQAVTVRVATGSTSATNTVHVYDNDIQFGLGRAQDAMRRLSDDLVRQSQLIQRLKATTGMPHAARTELAQWENAVNSKLRWLQEARTVIERALQRRGPAAALIAANSYLQLLSRDLMTDPQSPQSLHRTYTNNLVQRMRDKVTDNLLSTMTANVLATYAAIADVTLTRPLYTAVSGESIFGRPVTGTERLLAVGEIVLAYGLIRGSPRLVDWLADNAHRIPGNRPLPTRNTGGARRPTTGGGPRPAPPAAEPLNPTTSFDDILPPLPIRGRPIEITDTLGGLRQVNGAYQYQIPGSNINCQYCAIETRRLLTGQAVSQVPLGNAGNLWLRHGRRATQNAPNNIPRLRDWLDVASKDDIVKLFEGLPPLSHGYVVGWKANGSSHMFNVWRDIHGRVWFLDGQIGGLARFKGRNYTQFSVLLTDIDGAGLARMTTGAGRPPAAPPLMGGGGLPQPAPPALPLVPRQPIDGPARPATGTTNNVNGPATGGGGQGGGTAQVAGGGLSPLSPIPSIPFEVGPIYWNLLDEDQWVDVDDNATGQLVLVTSGTGNNPLTGVVPGGNPLPTAPPPVPTMVPTPRPTVQPTPVVVAPSPLPTVQPTPVVVTPTAPPVMPPVATPIPTPTPTAPPQPPSSLALDWSLRHGQGQSYACVTVTAGGQPPANGWAGLRLILRHHGPGGQTQQQTLMLNGAGNGMVRFLLRRYGPHRVEVLNWPAALPGNGPARAVRPLSFTVDADERNPQQCP